MDCWICVFSACFGRNFAVGDQGYFQFLYGLRKNLPLELLSLHFDTTRQTGAVFHMLSALGENGRIGFTAVGDSPHDAEEIYARVVRVLDEEAKAAVGLKEEVEIEITETEGGDFAI